MIPPQKKNLLEKNTRKRIKREEIDKTHRHTEKIRQMMPSDTGNKDCSDAATRPKKGKWYPPEGKIFP